MIRVASYNIRKCIGTDRRRIPARVLDVLAEVDAAVIALQEADRRFGDRPSALPRGDIESLGYRWVELGGRTHSIGWHGNAILVRDNAIVEHASALRIPTLEPRGAVMADIDFGSGPGEARRRLRVVGMHLDLSGLWRRRQMRSLFGHIDDRDESLPTVLMGDTNEWTRAGGCLREIGHGYEIADTGRSFHSRRPVAELDRIIVSEDVKLLGGGAHRTALAARASDHLPIWADIAHVDWLPIVQEPTGER